MPSHARIIFNDGCSEEFDSPLSPAECAEKLSWGASVPLVDGSIFYAEPGSVRSFTVSGDTLNGKEYPQTETFSPAPIPRDPNAWYTPRNVRGPLK